MNLWLLPVELVSSVINQAVSAQDQRASHYPHKITPCAMVTRQRSSGSIKVTGGLAAVAMLLGKAEVIHSRRRWRTKSDRLKPFCTCCATSPADSPRA